MDSEPTVIYESPDFVVLNKPAGLQVHAARVSTAARRHPRRRQPGAAAAPEPTLVDWLVKKYPEVKKVGEDPELRPGIVHRLDKATSGVMVAPRTPKAFEYLKAEFQKHAVKKTYLALAAGRFPEGRGVIDKPIGIRSGTLRRSVRSAKMAKEAVTEYKVLKTFTKENAQKLPTVFSLVELYPKTGRTHQLRVHLASIGHPIVGDLLYGPRRQPAWASRLMLHALALEFTAPDGRRVRFEAEPPF